MPSDYSEVDVEIMGEIPLRKEVQPTPIIEEAPQQSTKKKWPFPNFMEVFLHIKQRTKSITQAKDMENKTIYIPHL